MLAPQVYGKIDDIQQNEARDQLLYYSRSPEIRGLDYLDRASGTRVSKGKELASRASSHASPTPDIHPPLAVKNASFGKIRIGASGTVQSGSKPGTAADTSTISYHATRPFNQVVPKTSYATIMARTATDGFGAGASATEAIPVYHQ